MASSAVPPAQRAAVHPLDALFDAGESATALPVCDHYAGVEPRMTKSLALQAELGPVFDVTLDCEDGAPVGGEEEHAHRVAELIASPTNCFDRVGVRVHPLRHRAFASDLETLIRTAGDRLAYIMVPKPRSLDDVVQACAAIDRLSISQGLTRQIPVHALIETHGALEDVHRIAAHPRVQSLSFGLMDFVSAHRGAIPRSGMSVAGQFEHPLVVRAKLEIAAACHAYAKTPSHSVVTEITDTEALRQAARRASRELGYTRMWSIHPGQIRPIVEAFAPEEREIDEAAEILLAAQTAQWAPMRHQDTLHDRASYRYFWHVLERAYRTGRPVPETARMAFFKENT